MRRVLKILAWLLALFILLTLAGVVAIQSARVQTFLTEQVVKRLQGQMDADFSVGLVTLRPFDAIVLHDIVMKDPAPVIEGMDTVACINTLTVKFSLRGLLQGSGGVHVKRLKLSGGSLNLGYEPDSTAPGGSVMNLYRVLRLQEGTDSGEPPHWGNVLSAKYLEINNFAFRYASLPSRLEMEALGESYGEGVIDWNDFTVYVHELIASNVKMKDDLITGQVDRLRAEETTTGFPIAAGSAESVQVGKRNATMEGVHLVSGETDIYLSRFVMDGPLDDYGDFVNRIRISVGVAPGSVVSMPTLRYFSDGLEGITFLGALEGQVEGCVNRLSLKDIRVQDNKNNIRVRIDGTIKGLPDTDAARLDLQVKELEFGLGGLGGFVKAWSQDTDLDLSDFARGERFRFAGTVDGLLDHLHVDGRILSQIGQIRADATLHNSISPRKPIVIGGALETKDLNLGKILGTSSLGPLSLRTGLEATFDKDMQVRLDSLNISRLHALDYDYTNLSAVGMYSENAFDGRIIAADPNLNLLFQGIFNLSRNTRNAVYRFYASLGYADLHALHLDSRERSKVSFQASSNFLRTESRDWLGDVTISDISLESNTGRHQIGDLVVKAHTNDDVSRIHLDSRFLEGTYVGDASPARFLNDLQALVLSRDVPALLENQPEPWEGATYDLSFKFKEAQELFNFLVPGLYIERNSDLALKVDRAGLVTASVKSGRLAYRDKFVKDLLLNFDNGNQTQTAVITGKQISLSGTQILNNRLTLFADDNQIGVGYIFDNGEEESTRAELYLNGELDRDAEGLRVSARALPSNIYYKGNGWGLSSGEITYQGGNIRVERLQARHDDEILLVHGGISSTRADTLSVQMDKFDIGLLNTISGLLPTLEGHATGQATVISPTEPSIGLLASITCDSTYVAGHRMGTLELSSTWNDAEQRFEALVQNTLAGKHNISAEGYLKPDDGALQVRARLDRLNMGYAAPLLNSLFAGFGGYLSGELGMDGTLDKPHLHSRNLRVDDGRIELDYTRVPYNMSGDLALTDEGLIFQKVRLSDGQGGSGFVTGSILLGGFKNYALDTHLQFTDMKVVDLPRGVNSLMYGKAVATGVADITGPLNRLLLSVDAITSRSGDMHIALGSGGEDRSSEMLTFTEAADERETDPYEVMMAANAQEEGGSSDFQIKLRVRATEDMLLSIDLDESSLNARGSGTVELENSNDSFSLNGDYNISQGTFLFSVMNLVSRKFTIQDGSTIRFNGDIWDTDLDVKGLYTTKASLSNLIADGSAGNRRTVNCGIDITGRLSNPEVSFSIDVPDLNPATQAQVEGALNTVDKVQKQFVYLLIASNFLPGEESGINQSGSDVLFSNVSSIMSGQINNIFQKLNIPLDMGLNYQTTQAGSNIFDVALSTQLFNNRVIVNGTVGNKQQLGGTSTNEVVGDIDIEIKLNRSGSLRLKLFSHSADQYTSFLDNSQRHGGGISYQRDFNSFRMFLKTLFMSHENRERQMQRDILGTTRQVVLDIDENGNIAQE